MHRPKQAYLGGRTFQAFFGLAVASGAGRYPVQRALREKTRIMKWVPSTREPSGAAQMASKPTATMKRSVTGYAHVGAVRM